MNSYRKLFAEFRRRNVFKVAAVYGVVAFGLLQVADPLADAMRLPDTFVPFVVALLLLGFPVALVLAWAFEMTPDGVARMGAAAPGEIEAIAAEPASKRWPAGLLALGGVAALVLGAWWVGVRAGRGDVETEVAEARADSLQLAYVDAAADERPSIAVLPFADMSPGADQAYFSDGMTEEILNTLAGIRELKVTARTSAFAFRGRDLDMRAIGDSLGVAYLIEGSVRKAGDRLRITAQLIDASDGSHLWSEAYDRTLDDVFAIQTEIAEAIAAELRVPLGLDDASELVTPTADLEAYDLYLAGRENIRGRGPALRDAVRLLEAAVARDSSWAPAWAALAEAHELRSWYPASWDPPPVSAAAYRNGIASHQAAADRAARRALELDPDNATARVALGSVLRSRREWDAAERQFLRALSIDPDNAEAHQQYAEMLSNLGRLAEAKTAAQRAVRLDDAPVRRLNLAGVLWADDRPDEAAEQLRRGLEQDPEGHVPILLGTWYLMHMAQGEFERAIEFGYPDSPIVSVDERQHEQAVRAMRAGDPSLMPPGLDVGWPLISTTWQAFGDRDRALTAIENAIALLPAGGNLVFLRSPPFDPLRDEPRFRAILASRNLADAPLRRSPRTVGTEAP